MDKMSIRLLRADEIECRIGTITEKGLSLLLFKDARVDQKILDEIFSPFGWKRSHQMINGNLYCTVEIWDGDKDQWIAKQDVGTMSNAEKEKGQASDSFKRACFNWGIGRELYTAPFIWVSAEKAKIQMKNDKLYSNDRFRVKAIGYDEDRCIQSLVIVNAANQVVYALNPNKIITNMEKDISNATMQKNSLNKKQISEFEKELARTGVELDMVFKRYHIHSIDEMTGDIYDNAMRDLKKSKNRVAA